MQGLHAAWQLSKAIDNGTVPSFFRSKASGRWQNGLLYDYDACKVSGWNKFYQINMFREMIRALLMARSISRN